MALQKIAEIELAGEKFDLAKNGRFVLVRGEAPDAYGRPVAKLVETGYLVNAGRVEALLQLIGELTTRLQGQRDLRSGAEP